MCDDSAVCGLACTLRLTHGADCVSVYDALTYALMICVRACVRLCDLLIPMYAE